jgi:hypothetical protein
MVSLGADIAAALPELRAAAESMMRATFRITRAGGETWNPETLQNDSTLTTVYEGPGRLRAINTQDKGGDAADQAFIESQFTLSLPIVGSEGIEKDDVAECVEDPSDAAMTGRRFVVTWPAAQSDASARRLPVRETR